MIISNKVYDILKFFGRTVIPALAVLYASLGDVWGLPFVDQVPTSLMAIDLFLNTLLGIASENYANQIKGQEQE